MTNRKKICFIVSATVTASAFLDSHFRELSILYDIHLVANLEGKENKQYSNNDLCKIHHVKIQRKISLYQDLLAVISVCRILRTGRFDAIQTVTPKAGLIGMIAGYLTRRKHRIHIFTGQVWHTRTGLVRTGLKLIDRFVKSLATVVLVDSFAQRDYLIKHRILRSDEGIVLGKGTISGVDMNIFKADIQKAGSMRARFGYSSDEKVVLFLGRINKDKGVLDLAKAVQNLTKRYPTVRLLFVGYDEEELIGKIKLNLTEPYFIYQSQVTNPADYYQLCDIFVLPSYREGFGLSIIEASSCSKPVICSDTYGLRDSIIEGTTGLRHRVGDVGSIENAIESILLHPEFGKNLGVNGREYVETNFSSKYVTQEWVNFYKSLLNA